MPIVSPESTGVRMRALHCLQIRNPEQKAENTLALRSAFDGDELHIEKATLQAQSIAVPGRPDRPVLIDGKDVPRRGLGHPSGRVALLHALAHIEFNAINLALDAVYRFNMPDDFVRDWLKIAAEEAYHFTLIAKRLKILDSFYGAMPAHNGLWDMAVRTDHDVMVRMALVPRVLEARGLDVAPAMIEKLRQVGDKDSAAILDIIYKDEIGHVKIGNYWFTNLCHQRGLNPEETFVDLLGQYTHGFLRGPFNKQARTLAGFSDAELEALEKLDANRS